MTLAPRFPICPTCHGLHRNPPRCLGRPQTSEEWMVDRGVHPERAREIAENRARAGLGSLVLPPDPRTENTPPFGRPEAPPAPPPDQESLF